MPQRSVCVRAPFPSVFCSFVESTLMALPMKLDKQSTALAERKSSSARGRTRTPSLPSLMPTSTIGRFRNYDCTSRSGLWQGLSFPDVRHVFPKHLASGDFPPPAQRERRDSDADLELNFRTMDNAIVHNQPHRAG